MAANDDSARLLVSIEANQRAFAKQMATVAKQSADAAKYVETNFQRANDNVGRGFTRGANAATASTRQSAAAVSNLSFQLNDIAMGLASGTSPFTIMVQQGSQVSQALQGSGGLVGAVKTLGGALATMVNPVSLASFALIGLVGYAVQYFTSVDEGVDSSNKALKAHVDMISAVAKEWGDAVPALQAYARAAENAKNIADLRAATDLHIDEIFKQAREQIRGMSVDIADVVSQLRAAGTSEEGILKVQNAFKALKIAIDNGKDSTNETRELTNALISEWLNTGVTSAQAFAGSVNEIAVAFANYAREAEEARKQAEAAIQARRMEEFQKTLPGNLGQLSPLYSGDGQFLNPDQMNTFRAADERYRVAGESAAAQMVKGFENFISKAKWDVNAYRVGFGSDTVTRANGDIEKVTKDTIVTLEDAQRDLSRRLVEFQDGIQSAIGIETWESLNDGQQAALTSIAYNYGSLPKRIVAAIESGGGPEIVAKAIADLGADNGGINKRRRREEAETYLSGSGFSLKDVGIGGKSPADLFKGDLQQVQARIDALNAEYAAQAQLNPLVEDYGFAVEKARIQQQLLSEAQKAGLDVTPELRASIDQLAEGYARATSAAGQLKQSQEAVRQSAEDMRSLGRDVLGGFIRDLQAGKSASEALAGALQKVADKLLDIGLDSIFGGSGGGGGLFGNLLGGLFGGGGFNPVGKVGLFANGIANTGGARGQPRGVVHGQEAVIPLPAGGKVPVQLQAPQVAPTSTAAGRMKIDVGVSVDNDGNLQAFVRRASRSEAAAEVDTYDRKRAPGTAVKAVQQYQMRG